MFTGIVKACVPVVDVQDRPGIRHFVIDVPQDYVAGLQIGASVSVNGACHTVVEVEGGRVAFDAMEETLRKTNIALLTVGDRVNVERSAKIGDEIGGHLMSGHIIGMAEVLQVEGSENNRVVTFAVDPAWMKYILQKGFIGVNGCSLTVVDPNREEATFEVHLIPETLRMTNFQDVQVGTKVNLEIDAQTQVVVETVERMGIHE